MIIGLIGNLGRGKTLGMTMLGFYLRKETDLYHVVSNYQTDITTEYVKSSEELEKASKQIEGIYLLDEIWAWFNSRTAMENDTMVDIVLNSRKRGCLIIYTVQDLSQVDPILRKNTDYYGVCSHYEGHEVDSEHDVAEVQLITNNGEVGRNFRYNAETYYGTYNTEEEVSTVDDREKFKDYLEDVKKGIEANEFNSSITGREEYGFDSKREAFSFLELNTDLSHSKKDAIVDEAFRQAKNQNKDDKTEVNQTEL